MGGGADINFAAGDDVLLRADGSAHDVAAFEHGDVQSGLGKVGGADESVVSRAENCDIVNHARFFAPEWMQSQNKSATFRLSQTSLALNTGRVLTIRVIPCLDVHAGRVVKGVKFVELRDAGDPVECARQYDEAGADELVFLDITASHEGRRTMIETVERTADQVFMPLTVGGGISEMGHIRDLLRAGADKISLNTAAVKNPNLIREASDAYGCQCIVVAVDARRVPGAGERWEVFTHGGRTPTGLDAIEWIERVVELGAGEILLTSMDADGTKAGYDCEMLRAATSRVRVPVIASGGAGKLEHFSEAVLRGGAAAVLAASLFHFGELKINDVKRHLAAAGLPVRPTWQTHGASV